MLKNVETTVFVSLDPTEVGDAAPKQPLHITVVPPFPYADIDRILAEQVSSIEPFAVKAEGEDQFGRQRVRLVGSQALHRVHNRLMNAIMATGAEIDTRFALDQYSPHSTYIGDRGLAEGEERTIDALYVGVKELSPDGKLWRIAGKYDLRGHETQA